MLLLTIFVLLIWHLYSIFIILSGCYHISKHSYCFTAARSEGWSESSILGTLGSYNRLLLLSKQLFYCIIFHPSLYPSFLKYLLNVTYRMRLLLSLSAYISIFYTISLKRIYLQKGNKQILMGEQCKVWPGFLVIYSALWSLYSSS